MVKVFKKIISFSLKFFILVMFGSISTAILNVTYCQGANKIIISVFLLLVWGTFGLAGALIYKTIKEVKNGKSI